MNRFMLIVACLIFPALAAAQSSGGTPVNVSAQSAVQLAEYTPDATLKGRVQLQEHR